MLSHEYQEIIGTTMFLAESLFIYVLPQFLGIHASILRPVRPLEQPRLLTRLEETRCLALRKA